MKTTPEIRRALRGAHTLYPLGEEQSSDILALLDDFAELETTLDAMRRGEELAAELAKVRNGLANLQDLRRTEREGLTKLGEENEQLRADVATLRERHVGVLRRALHVERNKLLDLADRSEPHDAKRLDQLDDALHHLDRVEMALSGAAASEPLSHGQLARESLGNPARCVYVGGEGWVSRERVLELADGLRRGDPYPWREGDDHGRLQPNIAATSEPPRDAGPPDARSQAAMGSAYDLLLGMREGISDDKECCRVIRELSGCLGWTTPSLPSRINTPAPLAPTSEPPSASAGERVCRVCGTDRFCLECSWVDNGASAGAGEPDVVVEIRRFLDEYLSKIRTAAREDLANLLRRAEREGLTKLGEENEQIRANVATLKEQLSAAEQARDHQSGRVIRLAELAEENEQLKKQVAEAERRASELQRKYALATENRNTAAREADDLRARLSRADLDEALAELAALRRVEAEGIYVEHDAQYAGPDGDRWMLADADRVHFGHGATLSAALASLDANLPKEPDHG